MSQHSRPIWFAVLVTPWAGPLVLLLWSVLAIFFTEGLGGLKDWPAAVGFFVFGLPITYSAMLVFGLPYVLWLRARGTLTFPLVCLGAALAGALVPRISLFLQPQQPPAMLVIITAPGLGLISGMAFCIAAGITFRPSGRLRRRLIPALDVAPTERVHMAPKEATGLVVFFAISFGLPWVGWIFLAGQGLPYWLLPFSVSIAGFAASYAEGGSGGLRDFCRRTLAFRSAWKYIALAALIPISFGFLYLSLNGVGLTVSQPSLKPGFGGMLAMGLVGPLAEEFGWRGYLQHKLLSHIRPIWAASAIGAMWCIWHVPVFYSSVFSAPQSALEFLALCITWSIFLVYLVPQARGSVWPAVALHWSLNMEAAILGLAFSPAAIGLLDGLSATLFCCLAAIALVAVCKRFFFAPAASVATSNNSFKPKPLRGSA